jgi:excisionase family DNA binding protein
VKLSLTIDEARAESGLGRTTLYNAIRDGKLDAKKAGKRTLITGVSLKRFVDSLPPLVSRAKAA